MSNLHQPSDRGDGDLHPYGDCRRVTIASLPVAQFPNIVPPEIQLQASTRVQMQRRWSKP